MKSQLKQCRKENDFKTSELGLKPAHWIFIKVNQDKWSCSSSADGAANAVKELVPVGEGLIGRIIDYELAAQKVTQLDFCIFLFFFFFCWFRLKCDMLSLYITVQFSSPNPASLLFTAPNHSWLEHLDFYSRVEEKQEFETICFTS